MIYAKTGIAIYY